MKIDTTRWQDFVLGDICILEEGKQRQLPTGAAVPYGDLHEGDTPRITVTNVNNGIVGKYSSSAKNYRTYRNFISISFLGTVFYHPYEASLDMKVHCCKLKNVELNDKIGLFVATSIKKAISKYSYSDQLSSKVLADLTVSLPATKDNDPDWPYMENYILDLRRKVENWFKTSYNIDLSKREINISQWKEFPIKKLFKIKKGKRLTKADMRDGEINFIGASSVNNGITAKISNNEHLHPANTITVNYNGSVGVSFYQSEPYWASDDVNVLYPLFPLNKHVAMFLIPIIERKGEQYAFVDKWKKEYMEKDTLILPATNEGNPDWNYMEQYVEKIEESKKIVAGYLFDNYGDK